MYTIGSFGCERLAYPRIRMRAPSPVSPPDGRTLTPGSRAASISETSCTGALRRAAASIVATVLPSLRFSVSAPAPVTTTASSAIAALLSARSASVTLPRMTPVVCAAAVSAPTQVSTIAAPSLSAAPVLRSGEVISTSWQEEKRNGTATGHGENPVAWKVPITCRPFPEASSGAGDCGVNCWSDKRFPRLHGVAMAPFPYVERGMLVLALCASQACKEGASVSVPPPVDATFASVGAGLLHTCGRTVTNHVYCWGWNHDGEVGDGSTADRIYPLRASVALEFSAVTVGGGHSCGITSGGVPYCWGLNLTGQIGDGSTTSRSTPTPVVGALTFAGVANGGTFTCARASADSTARCWGWARDGELGSRPSETCSTTEGPEPCSRVPIAVGGGHEFIALAAGTRHVCGLATDSTARSEERREG